MTAVSGFVERTPNKNKYVPSNKIEIQCLYCKQYKLVWGHSNATFCCYQCSVNHKRDLFITSWLKEEINGTYEKIQSKGMHKRIPAWYKKNVFNCEICGISRIWNNKPLTFEIDHIDGNRVNNYFSNLRYICPNCHSQTDTFRIKNAKKKGPLA